MVSRNNVNDLNNVNSQIKDISNTLKKNKLNEIILVDDVVFSGNVLKNIISKFKNNDIDVIGIRSCISTIKAYNFFGKFLPLGLKCGYLLDKDVIDQICERDFYFGIAQSGISIKKDEKIYKAPYFLPFGNPVDRASIPKDKELYFSQSCLNRSLYLWKEIEKKSNKKIYIKDLPEKIINTKDNDRVIKVLKKGIR